MRACCCDCASSVCSSWLSRSSVTARLCNSVNRCDSASCCCCICSTCPCSTYEFCAQPLNTIDRTAAHTSQRLLAEMQCVGGDPVNAAIDLRQETDAASRASVA